MDPGGEADFAAFVAARWGALVRFGYLLVGDHGHAEDLVQQALERTWRRWDAVRTDRPEAYVRAALVNLATSRWRRRSSHERPAPDRRVDGAAPAEHPQGRYPLQDLLWVELQALPPRMRATVVLRVWEDLSEGETARLLGCSPGSVRSQLSRGLARLRERAGIRDAVGLAPLPLPEEPSTTARRPR